MKKIVIIICFMLIIIPASAKAVKGGVIYIKDNIEIESYKDLSAFQYKNTIKEIDSAKTLTIQEFRAGIIKTTAVVYKEEPDVVYFYQKTKQGYKCLVVEVLSIEKDYKKAVNYDAGTGRVLSIVVNVSDNENFVYNPKGKLIAHWIGESGVIFGKNLKIERSVIE